ncbi:catechol 2,3-dioxygenase [Aliarcobacter faecis]|uniref:catechol 2,3-dioxygenase n=1 Tax=Aliarcobacter faecis TaxID=1564138 RepID=UPI000479997C|nr:catechol 2,3-dioxygenase [Aliarcobacter faecis]QKF74001.1 catechol 2,3-dioxygenase [Aliarcobacter faecis]
MSGVMRIGHVDLNVLDINVSRNYYVNIMGMEVTREDSDGTLYLKCWDEWDKYSLVLRPSDEATFNNVAYKVQKDSDIDDLKAKIEAYGVSTEILPAGTVVECGRVLKFIAPSGHEFNLYAEKTFVGKDVGCTNPRPWPFEGKGIKAHWIDHALLMCKGPEKVMEGTKFFQEVLEFSLAEQVCVGPNGSLQAATWLSRTSTPHDLAFVAGHETGMHHFAFFLDGWNDILRAADVMAMHNVKIDVTPQRHGITRGETIYFFDPSGHRLETFAGLGYLMQPDMPTVTWTEDELWRGIFYHTGQENGAFTTAYTLCAYK